MLRYFDFVDMSLGQTAASKSSLFPATQSLALTDVVGGCNYQGANRHQ